MEAREPPPMPRHVELRPVPETLARTAYALYPEVLNVAIQHYEVYKDNPRVLSLELYYLPEECKVLRRGETSAAARKKAKRGYPVSHLSLIHI